MDKKITFPNDLHEGINLDSASEIMHCGFEIYIRSISPSEYISWICNFRRDSTNAANNGS